MHRNVILAIALSLTPMPIASVGAITPLRWAQNSSAWAKAFVSTEWFSVTYPDHWMITSQSPDFVMIFNQQPLAGGGEAPPYMIKTDIGIQPISLEEILQGMEVGEQVPPDFVEGPISRRIEMVVVAGRDAARVWEEGGETFPNSVVTYVPMNDQETAYVASFYNIQNQAAESAILQLHNSFELLP